MHGDKTGLPKMTTIYISLQETLRSHVNGLKKISIKELNPMKKII